MNDSDRFDRAIEDLLAGRSPRAAAPELTAEEQAMLQMAQLLRGSRPQPPRPEFVSSLRTRLFPHGQVSRRTAFLAGLGALAAGLVAGVGLPRLGSNSPGKSDYQTIIEPSNRHAQWFAIAEVAAVPIGAVVPFSAGAVQGYVLNRSGELRAMSRICTHMGCRLNFEQANQVLQCPCHGAEFDLEGRMKIGPAGYLDLLPSLPSLELRIRNQKIEVLSA